MHDGINECDRIILLCSQRSLIRPGVLNEVQQVLVREAEEGGTELLTPITIDDYLFSSWRPERGSAAPDGVESDGRFPRDGQR
jgi:hypothetical protein